MPHLVLPILVAVLAGCHSASQPGVDAVSCVCRRGTWWHLDLRRGGQATGL